MGHVTENVAEEEPETVSVAEEEPVTENVVEEEPVTENDAEEEPVTEYVAEEEPVTEYVAEEEPVTENVAKEEPEAENDEIKAQSEEGEIELNGIAGSESSKSPKPENGFQELDAVALDLVHSLITFESNGSSTEMYETISLSVIEALFRRDFKEDGD